jgi:hypothetical protein
MKVSVMAAARSIGLVIDARGEVSGTIDEYVVRTTISALAADYPGNDDLLANAAVRVQLARSAGIEQSDPTSVLQRSPAAVTVQLRYRSEMADVFTDVAIDVGLRDVERLADTPACRRHLVTGVRPKPSMVSSVHAHATIRLPAPH